MNVWPERGEFKRLVLEYRRKHGLARDAMAEILGLKESSLHCLLYDKRVRPSLDVVQKASEVFAVPIAVLASDPGGNVPGLGEPAPAILDLRTKAELRAMGTDLTRLTEEQRAVAIRTWRAMVDGFLSRR